MEKIVKFDEWCPNCKYEETNENDDPCEACLTNSVRDAYQEPSGYLKKEE